MSLLVSSISYCQDDNLKALQTSFSQYSQQVISEKMFAHTDKNFYLAGEILWFKLYVVNASTNKPLDLSKVAYVEVLDTANKPLLQAKTDLEKGDGKGSFYLPLTLNSGNYKFRAYTNWMKNDGTDHFFEKMIRVVNVQKVTPANAKDNRQNFDVQFFPEGGNLVNNLQSKIAFKVFDKRGSDVKASGFILDGADTVVKFSTLHAGRGNFLFTPLTNHSYNAYIQTPDGNVVTKELPGIYSTGCVMNVSSDNGTVKVNVQSNMNDNAVYLLVNSNNTIEVAEKSVLQNGQTTFTFNPSVLKEGISHITIFNSNKQPLCERLYFKKPSGDLQLKMSTDQSFYSGRKKVVIDISSAALTENDSASLSMSVYRLDSIQTADNSSIASYLLLGSELRGYIEDPQYYFQQGSEAGLDNLLLTNGWRKFKWENILQNKKPLFAFEPEYNGHIITGRVTVRETGNPVKDIGAYLSVPGTKTQFVTAMSDSDGNVKFEMKDFYGSSEIIAQIKGETDSKYRISIKDPFSNAYTNVSLPSFDLPLDYPNTLLEQSISMQVQNIYTSNKLKQFYQPDVDSTPFYVKSDAEYLLDNYTRFKTIEEVLREYVTMVNVTRRNGTYHFPVLDKGHDVMFQGDPLLLLDAVPISNFDKFMNFDPYKLRSLEVVNRKYIYGTSTFDGILNWKTYNGDLGSYELDPNMVIVDYDGLQLQREFYSPVYDDEKQMSHLPDFRNVLYWKPDIHLKKDVKNEIIFYTSDIPGTYAAIVQGLSSNGLPGTAMVKFEVKNN